MSKIFDGDSDPEEDYFAGTDNEYAKNYNNWRKKEELNKLKTKYGEETLKTLEDESSSSSDDDEEGIELTDKVEKEFYRTLSYLKNKDPRIYDDKVKFFDDSDAEDQTNEAKKKQSNKKEKPMYLKDYERNIILEKNGQLSDEDDGDNDNNPRSHSPTYIEEQKIMKDNLKKALDNVTEDNENDDDWGGMLKQRQKTRAEKIEEEESYKQWLLGQKEQIEDKDTESDLKPLKEYWNNPNLDIGEKFLRDYILNKRFLNKDDPDYIPTYEEVVHDSDEDFSEDETAIEKQEEFEHKYNFRFEEPDQDFIKRYPRTVEQSLRKSDDRRKVKRVETKERKQKEKEQKMQDLKKLQELKKSEIEEKIQKLKEITGNTDVAFADDDVDGDFDPEAHDRRMQSLFNDEFYEGNEEDQKPEFPELDEYLELENWEKWDGKPEENEDGETYEPHCEDDDFNMDCDYDPNAKTTQSELIENSKSGGRKKRKRKSLFAKAVSQPKPAFDPNDKTYEQYLDEYYKFDCEDIIGDVPCRFKYRKVVPNSFGLSAEEILLANDRELNKWCSIKKAIQIRPDHIEKYDQIAFDKKGKNVDLKKRILPSLFQPEETKSAEDNPGGSQIVKNRGKKRRSKGDNLISNTNGGHNVNSEESVVTQEKSSVDTLITKSESNPKKKKKKNKNKKEKRNTIESACSSTQPKVDDMVKKANKQPENAEGMAKNSRKRKHQDKDGMSGPSKKKIKGKQKAKKGSGGKCDISDARLSAYGINPKKFKNKIKYGQSKE